MKNKKTKTKIVTWIGAYERQFSICLDEKIRLQQLTNKINAIDVKKMKWMMRNILDKQPYFIHFLVGEIHSPNKILRLTPIINFPLKEDYEFITAGESATKEKRHGNKKQKRKPTRRR